MSFSSEVKQELAELTADKPCCRAALAYGLLEFGHAFTGSRMSLQTEHAAVAHLYSALAADVCGIAPPAVQTLPRRGGFCIVSVEGDAPRARVLERFGHSPADLAVRLNRANLECDGCAPALLRGAFLACGAVIDLPPIPVEPPDMTAVGEADSCGVVFYGRCNGCLAEKKTS